MVESSSGLKRAAGRDDQVLVQKPYRKPAIVCELELETRAGSPLGKTPLGLDPLQGIEPGVNPR